METTEIRHLLHQHPELSGCEKNTHDLIVKELTQLHPLKIYTHVGSTPQHEAYGVIAVFGQDLSAPAIAFRADIDALPIQEQNSLPYRSVNQNIGHKCGHDGHTAILLELAQHLHACRNTVILIFQPEEETGLGSKKILQSGILKQYDIRAIYAIHNLPGYPLNQLVLIPNTFAAASSGFIIHLHGRQTHASTPEKGINPALAISQLIQRFDTFNHVNINDIKSFSQSTPIYIRCGSEAFGTSAGEASLAFTLRAYTNETMEWLLQTARSITNEVAQNQQLKVDIELREPFYATENNLQQVVRIQHLAHSLHLSIHQEERPFRWSEDFADYLMVYPGAMMGIGSGEDHVELHHPDYDFPDQIIRPTAQLFLEIANAFNPQEQNN